MYIDELWAEELAISRNCLFINVCTMDFEAKAFYDNLGYYLEFERHGYEKSSILYFLRKDLK